jgi:hypothetical protein
LLVIAPLVALNVAVADPAVTVTDAGVFSTASLLDRVTMAPPLKATCVKVTVQVVDDALRMGLGLHLSEET